MFESVIRWTHRQRLESHPISFGSKKKEEERQCESLINIKNYSNVLAEGQFVNP